MRAGRKPSALRARCPATILSAAVVLERRESSAIAKRCTSGALHPKEMGQVMTARVRTNMAEELEDETEVV